MISTKVLSQMVEQFRQQHKGTAPRVIVVAPVALLALGIKRSVKPVWEGIPVECRLYGDDEAVKWVTCTRLAIFVYKGDLRAHELT